MSAQVKKAGETIKVPKGTRDTLPLQMAVRDKALAVIKKVFTRHGAVSIDTPVFELKSTLAGKYGEECGKLIYELADQGGESLALRYDLTVPLVRFINQHGFKELKRYHIGRVYRRDNPVMTKGRFREFFQCDFDIVGNYAQMPMAPDAECLKIMTEVIEELEIGAYEIKINHRHVLDAILEFAGVPADKFCTTCSSIDKLDKMAWADVAGELVRKEIDAKAIETIGTFVKRRGSPTEILDYLEKSDLKTKAERALRDMAVCIDYLRAFGCLDKMVWDLSLARGLDYYTGLITEAMLVDNRELGSVAAGGRYDHLIGTLGQKEIQETKESKRASKVKETRESKEPQDKEIGAVGISIGIERILSILEIAEQKRSSLRESSTQVLVCSVGKDPLLVPARLQLCAELWRAQIATEFVYQTAPKPDKQMQTALKRGIPVVIFVGGQELKDGTLKVKDMIASKEHTVPRTEAVAAVRRVLGLSLL